MKTNFLLGIGFTFILASCVGVEEEEELTRDEASAGETCLRIDGKDYCPISNSEELARIKSHPVFLKDLSTKANVHLLRLVDLNSGSVLSSSDYTPVNTMVKLDTPIPRMTRLGRLKEDTKCIELSEGHKETVNLSEGHKQTVELSGVKKANSAKISLYSLSSDTEVGLVIKLGDSKPYLAKLDKPQQAPVVVSDVAKCDWNTIGQVMGSDGEVCYPRKSCPDFMYVGSGLSEDVLTKLRQSCESLESTTSTGELSTSDVVDLSAMFIQQAYYSSVARR
jgi:hypothetical protein